MPLSVEVMVGAALSVLVKSMALPEMERFVVVAVTAADDDDNDTLSDWASCKYKEINRSFNLGPGSEEELGVV